MIRVFRDADREAVVALWSACDLVVPWNVPEDDIAHKLAFQPDLFFVAERGGEVRVGDDVRISGEERL